ncbi:hypothetical protein [Agarivorans sp. JK6]|uniref:hypothetical protein n=1 Tax=Agarivorans sp. JK6 TaxID=2997426 RepID=UPI0038734AA9
MKQSFLYKNFRLWFGTFFVWSLILGVLFGHLPLEIARTLTTLTGTLFIALLAGMVAIHHLDINEQRKLAREQYQSYATLLYQLHQRYHSLETIHQTTSELVKIDWYLRGLRIPHLITVPAQDLIDFSQLAFFIKGRNKSEAQRNQELDCFNVPYISGLDNQYHTLMAAITRRNELLLKTFMPVMDTNYQGAGVSNATSANFKKANISYAEFTKFLHLSETIAGSTEEYLIQIIDLMDNLGKHAKKVLSEDICDEFGGFFKLEIPVSVKERIEAFKYKPLSKQETDKFHQADYPAEKNDYEQIWY